MAEHLLRYPATLSAGVCLLAMASLFWATGALWPENLPAGAGSPARITGMALMLTLQPPYLIAASIVVQRRSIALVGQLRPLLPTARDADDAVAAIRGGLRQTWLPASLAGIAMGLMNAVPIFTLTRSPTPLIDSAFSLGQIFLWLVVGLLLGMRTVTARAFSRLGEGVEIDLFRLDRLKPLARSGTLDLLVIAGALVLVPLQSLDAEFRWYNYRFALWVAIPAGAFLLLWPLRSVHARIHAEKQRRIRALDDVIAQLPAADSEEELLRLEALLAHRDRLHDQRTWPIDTAILSRAFLYLIIPPLAWAGAALVELFVDRLVGP